VPARDLGVGVPVATGVAVAAGVRSGVAVLLAAPVEGAAPASATLCPVALPLFDVLFLDLSESPVLAVG
jgi:hypothetical protein